MKNNDYNLDNLDPEILRKIQSLGLVKKEISPTNLENRVITEDEKYKYMCKSFKNGLAEIIEDSNLIIHRSRSPERQKLLSKILSCLGHIKDSAKRDKMADEYLMISRGRMDIKNIESFAKCTYSEDVIEAYYDFYNQNEMEVIANLTKKYGQEINPANLAENIFLSFTQNDFPDLVKHVSLETKKRYPLEIGQPKNFLKYFTKDSENDNYVEPIFQEITTDVKKYLTHDLKSVNPDEIARNITNFYIFGGDQYLDMGAQDAITGHWYNKSTDQNGQTIRTGMTLAGLRNILNQMWLYLSSAKEMSRTSLVDKEYSSSFYQTNLARFSQNLAIICNFFLFNPPPSKSSDQA